MALREGEMERGGEGGRGRGRERGGGKHTHIYYIYIYIYICVYILSLSLTECYRDVNLILCLSLLERASGGEREREE